jgi:hypothetical protein
VAGRQPDGALGFAEETWWRRCARPQWHTWAAPDEGPLRLVEQDAGKTAADPKALACSGVLLRQVRPDAGREEPVWLRVVAGRPVSASTEPFLGWCCPHLPPLGVRGWALSGDHACWQVSKRVRAWMRAPHRTVQHQGRGVRILPCAPCRLPVKSPWRTPIEPQWGQGKRAIVEPARLLSAQEVADRVCADFACSHEPHLTIPDKAA